MTRAAELPWSFFLTAVAIRCVFDFGTLTRRFIDILIKTDDKNPLNQPSVRKGAMIVGFLEGVIYIYFLVKGYHAAIAAVLIFKGFHLWTTANAPHKDVDRQPDVLSNYYSYAIGNFISFLLAVLIVEGLLLASRKFIWLSFIRF